MPVYFGVPEEAVFIGYAGLLLLLLVTFHSVILKTEYVLLVIALGFFGLSAGLDVLDPPGINPYLFNDGAKLAGTVSWLAYFFRTGASPLFHKAGRPSALDGPPALESSEFEPVSLKDYQSPRKARGIGYGRSSRRE